jgi:uncharacterized membrane protein YhaH (DUF805 family)
MGFGTAVSTCFQKYVTFSGRARRSEFWWWQVFTVIAGGLALLGDNLLGLHYTPQDATVGVGWLYTVVVVFLLLPSIAVLFRRLHDTGRSGWWWVLAWVCCVGEVLLFFFCISGGTQGHNQYGPDPKGA